MIGVGKAVAAPANPRSLAKPTRWMAASNVLDRITRGTAGVPLLSTLVTRPRLSSVYANAESGSLALVSCDAAS